MAESSEDVDLGLILGLGAALGAAYGIRIQRRSVERRYLMASLDPAEKPGFFDDPTERVDALGGGTI
jgi:hypothetical protein